MNELRVKALFYFSAAIFLSIILGWFGSLLFTHSGSISSTTMILFGAGMIISGICIFSLMPQMVTILAAVGFLLVGLYSFGRAAGAIEQPWLATIIGICCWIAVGLILYITWPPISLRRWEHADKDEAKTPEVN